MLEHYTFSGELQNPAGRVWQLVWLSASDYAGALARGGDAVASLDRIRTDGFRKWYERQLIECHAWLLSWFLAVIVLVSGLELAGSGAGGRPTGAAFIFGGLALTLYSWNKYRVLLEVAERLGEQASCPTCNAYGRFLVQASGPCPMPDGGDPVPENTSDRVWLRAQCKKCHGEWLIK